MSSSSQPSEPDVGPLLRALKAACTRHMLAALPVDPTATMRELDFRSLHSVYAGWRDRVPAARPRRVHIAPELLANPDRLEYRDGLAATVREIARGDDLRPRMSTLVEQAYKPAEPQMLLGRPAGRPHVDRLLADWGLHHLHLGATGHRRRPEFVRRTPHVLFVAFKATDAYLVDIAEHESGGANWSALNLLEIIVRNWPNEGILVGSNFAVGLKGGNWSDEDRRKLRQADVSTGAVEIDGRVWSSGGQTVGGVSMHVARHCMHVSWTLTGYDPTEQQVKHDLRTIAEKHGVPDDWRAIIHGEEFGFYSTGVFVDTARSCPDGNDRERPFGRGGPVLSRRCDGAPLGGRMMRAIAGRRQPNTRDWATGKLTVIGAGSRLHARKERRGGGNYKCQL